MKRTAFAFVAISLCGCALAESRIRVALFADGKCTDERSREAAWNLLRQAADFEPEKVTSETVLAEDFSSRYDVMILPGGTASGQGNALGVEGGRKLTQFVQHGKGLIAICAGGYYVTLGGTTTTRELDLINAVNWDSEHWARGEDFIAVKTADTNSSRTMWYQNGPIFAPGVADGLAKYTPLVRYETDMAAKGAPKGMMTGRDAVIAGRYGKGRVVAFGPHPELSPDINQWLVNAIRWAAGGNANDTPSFSTVLEPAPY